MDQQSKMEFNKTIEETCGFMMEISQIIILGKIQKIYTISRLFKISPEICVCPTA